MDNKDRCKDCDGNQQIIQDLKSAVFGNSRIGIQARVIKLEVLIWIVILLLVGNGALLGWTIKTVNLLSIVANKLEATK